MSPQLHHVATSTIQHPQEVCAPTPREKMGFVMEQWRTVLPRERSGVTIIQGTSALGSKFIQDGLLRGRLLSSAESSAAVEVRWQTSQKEIGLSTKNVIVKNIDIVKDFDLIGCNDILHSILSMYFDFDWLKFSFIKIL